MGYNSKNTKKLMAGLKNQKTFSRPQLAIFILAFAIIGYLVFKSFAASNPNLPGDLNNDNTVNAQDLSLLLSNYGTTNPAGDVNSDGTVNAIDLSILLSHYGQSITSGTGTVLPSTVAHNIDGNLNEADWKITTPVTKSVIGTGNNTVTFGTLWDSSYLYVGVKVLDGNLFNDSSNCWDDDSVEVYVDPTNAGGTTYTPNDRQIVQRYNDPSLCAGVGSSTGVLHAWAAITGGYSVELAIPWSLLGTTASSGKIVGFDVGVNDDDNGGSRDSQMMWNGTANNSSDPSNFGHLTLNGTPTGGPPTGGGGASSSIYWGAYIEGAQTYSFYYGGSWENSPWDLNDTGGATTNKFETNAGKKVAIIHYGQPEPWNQAFQPSVAGFALNHGSIPMIDEGESTDNLQTMVNGGYDSAITTWANAVKAWGHPFFLRPWWEMNGTWFNWGKTAASNPALYVSAWKHYHDVVANAGANNVTWVWCPNLEFSGSTPLSQLYPGDSYVDWTCLDGYNQNSASESFATLYQQSYNDLLALAPTKPIMIGEISSHEYSGAKAAWITDAIGTQLPQNFPKIKALVWFNWRNTDDNGVTWNDWPIESSTSATTAFNSAIKSNYYAPGSSSIVNLPALTKVQPLP